MAKVITFSRLFQTSHPKAGQPTFFVEQLINSLGMGLNELTPDVKELVNDFFIMDGEAKKHHTVRKGNRFKVGDKFSPRVWGDDINPKTGRSGPYHSKQITIAPDVEVKQVWDIEVNCRGGAAWFKVCINDKIFAQLHHGYDRDKNKRGLTKLAKNDGLSLEDFEEWFYAGISPNKPFIGQIICWSDEVKY